MTAPLEQRLVAAGATRRQAEERRLTAARSLHDVVRQAAAAGWSKTRIAQTAGISRQTVHDILKENR